MIGPFEKFAELAKYFDGERYLALPREEYAMDLPSQEDINKHANARAVELGLEMGEHECLGAYYVIPVRDERGRATGAKKYLERVHLYGLAKPEEVVACAEAMVDYMARLYGSGRVWTLGGRAHVIHDCDAAVFADVLGERHACVRSFFVHENGPGHMEPR